MKRLLILSISNPNVYPQVNILIFPYYEILLKKTIKRNEATAWINLRITILSEKSQVKRVQIV